ncbi:maltase A3-like [Planococcus citri]|uniref:maltase A3-like n=1 Tax=Planococcus citri TaxID=170843 RepID=UPI0031F7EA2E
MYMDFEHIYTVDLPETYELIKNLRKFVHRITKKFGDYERVLIGELYSEYEAFRKYYRTNGERILHFPLNTYLNGIKEYYNASFYRHLITSAINVVPTGETMNWNSDNHDRYRKGLWFNEEYEYMYVTMVMLLPGVAYHYYGQEIAMTGCEVREDQHIDTHLDTYTKTLRDAARTPMQWDDSLNAGFSNNHKTYLPVCPNYWRLNVEKQKREENSRYNMFKKMSHLRKRETLRHGDVKLFTVSAWVFAFTRSLEDRETFLMITNLGTETEIVDLHISIKGLPAHMKVEIASQNSGYKNGDKVSVHPGMKNVFTLRPASTVVLSAM